MGNVGGPIDGNRLGTNLWELFGDQFVATVWVAICWKRMGCQFVGTVWGPFVDRRNDDDH